MKIRRTLMNKNEINIQKEIFRVKNSEKINNMLNRGVKYGLHS